MLIASVQSGGPLGEWGALADAVYGHRITYLAERGAAREHRATAAFALRATPQILGAIRSVRPEFRLHQSDSLFIFDAFGGGFAYGVWKGGSATFAYKWIEATAGCSPDAPCLEVVQVQQPTDIPEVIRATYEAVQAGWSETEQLEDLNDRSVHETGVVVTAVERTPDIGPHMVTRRYFRFQ